MEATTTSRVEQGYPARNRYKGSVAEDYLEGRIYDRRWQREQDVLEKFLRQIAPESALLDIPLGTGRFIEFYAGLGHRVYGLDVSRDMVAQAQSEAATHQASLLPLLGEAERIPLRDGSVDYVVCVRFLNWVPLPVVARILGEFDRVARKGVLVHIRTRKTLTGPALAGTLVRELSSEPVGLLRRFAGAAKQGLLSSLRSLAPNASPQAPPEQTGHVLHDAASLERAFAEAGFFVREKIPIETTTAYAKSQSEPLDVYVLERKGQHD